MMAQTLLDLAFKGKRDYLHGTDVLNQTLFWLQDALPGAPLEDIDFSFHHLAHHQVGVRIGASPAGQSVYSVCAFTQGGRREKAYLIETDMPVTRRYPYPEEEIVAPMQIDSAVRRGVLLGTVEYTDIEVWVAMTKALHHAVFPQAPSKWLFVRGRFPNYTRRTQARERTLAIAASLRDRLTRSEAFLDGRKVGEIFFSLV